jgi:hypothetical protein
MALHDSLIVVNKMSYVYRRKTIACWPIFLWSKIFSGIMGGSRTPRTPPGYATVFGKFPYAFGSFIIMSHPQSWHLSQEANKASGVCSVCLNVRQLHLKDGLVHRHGPRHQPCAGSHKPPLADSVSQTEQKSQHVMASVMASACLPVLVGNGHSSASDMVSAPLNEASYTASETCSFASTPSEIFSHERPAWFSSYCNPGIIKHIPKSARSVCATHLAGLFNRVVSNSTDIERWHDILGWPKAILFSSKRGGLPPRLGENRISQCVV